MTKAVEIFQTLRDRHLSWGLRSISIAGFFALLISFLKVFSIGWHPVMTLHIILYLIILGTTLLNHRLSFLIRAIIVTACTFVLGATGLLSWGLLGFGLQALFAFCILSMMLFGHRIGIISALLSIVIIGIVGFLFRFGILTYHFDPMIYLASFTSWMAAMSAMAISAGLIVVALGSLNREIENLVDTLQNQNREMAEVIHRLEREMAERVRIEGERQRLEERLQRAKRMEDLGTLAGGVAHDLNNLLIGTVSYPDLLLAKLPQGSPLREPIEHIKNTGVKAAAMVEDLLNLARRNMAPSHFLNLNSIITDYFNSPEYQKLKSFHPHVEVEFNLDQNLPNILGSSIHLHKTLMNLVSNAAEAMPDGGKVVVSTRSEHTGYRPGLFENIEEGDYVVLNISDTGMGIPPGDIEKIFEPFYTKKVLGRSGTGLGMAVVWNIIKDHRGYIEAESVMGKGTTFTLYFPMSKERIIETQETKSMPIKEYIGNGESILVVDDMEEQREIFSHMLSQLGYSVNAVASGEEAIAYLEKFSADLLILDMYIGHGMDGLDTYRKVLELKPKQKALLTSGYAETWRIKEAQRLGAGAYIKKPFFLNDIGLAIRSELDR